MWNRMNKNYYVINQRDSLSIDFESVWYDKWKATTRRCFVRKSVLRNFAKITRKHLCLSLFFNKVAGLRHIFFKEHLRTTASGWRTCTLQLIIYSAKWCFDDKKPLYNSNYFIRKNPLIQVDNSLRPSPTRELFDCRLLISSRHDLKCLIF